MIKYIALTLFLLSLILFTAQVSTSISNDRQGPYFADVIVTNSKMHLLLFGTLKNSFTEEMIEGLHSGLPIYFSIFVELNRTRDWMDERLVSLEIKHFLTYDTLKEMYKVELEETSKKDFSFQTLQEAQKAINEINGLKVVQLTKLVPDASYSLKIKAELYKKTLPMKLHKFIPFVSWWDMDTDWHSISFRF